MKRIKEFLKRFFHKWRLIRYGIYFFVFLTLYVCRVPILRGLGHWLIEEDKLEKADAIVLLGGNSLERGREVKRLFDKKYAAHIICTGSHVSPQLQSLGLRITEAQNSKKYLVKLGIPDSCIAAYNIGTSTMEEAGELKKLAKQKGYKKLILVSSKFHTARVHKYVNRVFEGSGVRLIIRGAMPLKYKIDTWWHSEDGLLFVNNEYVKSFYYWWKY
ncbi:MAG TPA: YdcF family protein [Flavobacteriales bacterium]|nr:YdcF family protein [Flavobacteriales bacterium]